MFVKLLVKNDIPNIQSVKEDQSKNFLNVFTNIFQHFIIFDKILKLTIFSIFSTFTTILNNFFTIFLILKSIESYL